MSVKQVREWITVQHSCANDLVPGKGGRAHRQANCGTAPADSQHSQGSVCVITANKAPFYSENRNCTPQHATKLHKQIREEWKQVLYRRPRSFCCTNPSSAAGTTHTYMISLLEKVGHCAMVFFQDFTHQLISTSENT